MQTYNTYWIAPVDIILHQNERLSVEGPLQAVRLMEGDWPEKTSEHYRAALRECDLACRLRGGLGSSRERFVAAALAARALVQHQPSRHSLIDYAAGSFYGAVARESQALDTPTAA